MSAPGAELHVLPEGTFPNSRHGNSPFSSCNSLHPSTVTPPSTLGPPFSRRRLPKAPVFIKRPPAGAPQPVPGCSFISDDHHPVRMELPRHHTITVLPASEESCCSSAEAPPSRLYDFHDDFPSIAASASTRAHSNVDTSPGIAAAPKVRRGLPRRGAGTSSNVTDVDDAESARRKRYTFSDDFVSIPGSESTSVPPNSIPQPRSRMSAKITGDDIDLTRNAPYSFTTSERPSFASSIRRRISHHPAHVRYDDEGLPRGSFKLSKREKDMDDSIVNDWKRASRMTYTPPVSMTSEAPPKGCASFMSKMFVMRTKNVAADPPQQHRFNSKQETERCSAVMDDKTVDDVHFISILAYDDFMHSPNSPSLLARMFSRLRRA